MRKHKSIVTQKHYKKLSNWVRFVVYLHKFFVQKNFTNYVISIYYKNRGTTVYVTFLDASKAFDRLNYWLLFDKLIKKHVPLFIIKLLCFWYTSQKMFVRWGATTSTQFTVSNGVKQGGIISPILFNVYMDDLSIALNSSGIGGYLGAAFLNHLCYADDLCLISLSSNGMQQLLNICQNYATNHQLLYNGAKSFSLCFKDNTI